MCFQGTTLGAYYVYDEIFSLLYLLILRYLIILIQLLYLPSFFCSYGVKFPVPEKRRKRLLQEYNDIEKVIRKKR